MKETISQILRQFEDPDISSSAIPLLLIMITFLVGSFAVLAKFIFKFPRRLKRGSTLSSKITSSKRLLELYRKLLKLRWPKVSLPKWRLPAHPPSKANQAPVQESLKPKSTEIEQLRALVQKLEEANAIERELNAKSIRKVTELQGELQNLFLKWQEEQRLLEFERSRRAVLEERIFHLENQIQAAIEEAETIFEKSAAVPTPKVPEGLDSDEPMIALPDPEIAKQKKDKVANEIREMIKDLPGSQEDDVRETTTSEQAEVAPIAMPQTTQATPSTKSETVGSEPSSNEDSNPSLKKKAS